MRPVRLHIHLAPVRSVRAAVAAWNGARGGVAGTAIALILGASALLTGCYPGLDAIDKETTERIRQAGEETGTEARPELPDIRSKYEGNYFVEDKPHLRAPLTNNPVAKDITFRDRKERDLETQAVIGRMQAMGVVPADAVTLTLESSLAFAFKKSFEVQTAQQAYLLAALQLLTAENFFALIPNADVGSNIRVVDASNIGLVTGLDPDVYNTALSMTNNLGLTQRLPLGGVLSAKLATTWTEQVANALGDPTQVGSFLTLGATFPFLRGAGLVASEPLIQAQRNMVYSARDFEDFRRRFALAVTRAYLDLAVQQQIINNSRQQVGRLRFIEQREQALVASGRQVPFQADLASQRTLFAVDRLSALEEGYRLAVDEFKVKIGMDVDTPVVIEPEMLDLPVPEITPDKAVQIALDLRLDVQNLRDQLDDLKRQVDIAKNGLLPELRLTGTLVQPIGSTQYDDTVNVTFENTDATAGIFMSIPLNQVNEQSALRQAQVILETGVRNYVNFRDESATQVRAAVRGMDRSLFSYRLAERGIKVAQNRQASIDAAPDRATPRDTTDAVDALGQAQDTRDRAKRDLQVAILGYLVASGQMRVAGAGVIQLPGERPLVIQRGTSLSLPLSAPPPT